MELPLSGRTKKAGRLRRAVGGSGGDGRAAASAAPVAAATTDGARGEFLGGRLSRRTVVIVLAALAMVGFVYLVVFTNLPYGFHDISDTQIYFEFAGRMVAGERPYADLPLEYPPLAVPLFLLPGHSDDLSHYWWWFSGEMLVVCAAAAAVTAAAAARLWPSGHAPYLAAFAFAVGVACTGAILANRYDIVVALVLALALLLLAGRHWVTAAVVLGLGFALKLTPAILLPLVLVLAERPRRMLWAAIGFAVAAIVPFLPFLTMSYQGVKGIFTYHLERPLQIESVLATPMMVGSALGRVPVVVGTAYGSQFVSATGAETAASLSGWLTLAALAIVYALIWRRRTLLRAAPPHVPLAVFALIVAFMTFGKVLSPQYFIWILPVVALVFVEHRLLGALALLTLLLTQIEFPGRYWSLVYLESGTIWLLAARNALLVACFFVSLWELWRLPPNANPDAAVYSS